MWGGIERRRRPFGIPELFWERVSSDPLELDTSEDLTEDRNKSGLSSVTAPAHSTQLERYAQIAIVVAGIFADVFFVGFTHDPGKPPRSADDSPMHGAIRIGPRSLSDDLGIVVRETVGLGHKCLNPGRI